MALINKTGLVLFVLSSSLPTALSFNNRNKNLHRPPPHHLHATTENIEYGVDVPYSEASYDPHAAAEFYKDRPIESFTRLAQIITKSGSFIVDTVLDAKLNREEKMVDRRSDELLELVSDLGPAFVKIGQALSARTDLLPAKYAKGLTGLQDAVPPFSAELGRKVIEQELNINIDEIFSSLSLEPVASASIGQVYRGTLRESGEEVAVKVQRPSVLSNVALDLYMLRTFAPLYQKQKEINTDLVGLVDAWGEGFVNELDYRAEAKATTSFSKAMKERGLGSVFAPEVVEELSSIHVLTTKWVDGERLSDSDADDVPRLCGVALNAYLTMLLDTGTLHCDPHPGNLLRTPDGRLCILDWGMIIDVPEDLQLSLLEFIADLNAENYEDVPDDLVKLQFVPEHKIEELRQSGLTVAISNMLSLAAEGGGPKGAMKRMVLQNKEKYAEALAEFDDIDSKEATSVRQRLFQEDWKKQMAEDAISRGDSPSSTTVDVTMKIEQMQEQNADVFAIPDYFVYMSRAFSTLEGIGLQSDSNYSILQECYPYLAKRLLSDDSPRARGALRMLLYGKGDELDLSKVQELSDGFESYTTSTSSVESGRGRSEEGRNAAIEQLANVLLSEDSNYVQDLLLRETAVALDATIRDVFLSPLEPILNLPFPPSLRPFTLPLELAKASLELQAIDKSDQKRLENVRILTDALNKGSSSSSSSSKTTENSSGNTRSGSTDFPLGRLIQEASKRRLALTRIGVRFGGSLTSVQAERLRERASGANDLGERLAVRGADALDVLADAISSLDSDLAKIKAKLTAGFDFI
jgi:predicted unusual protein kinase regulating ubiquinone biosynthesis (AarF/ABC1/UbiB family)